MAGSPGGAPELDPSDRAALIRRGKELFKRGDLATAERVFLTAGYADGLKRLADLHFRGGKNIKKAIELYRAAGGREADAMYEMIASGIKYLLAKNDAPSGSTAARPPVPPRAARKKSQR